MRRGDREITDFTKMMDILKICDCCRLGLIDTDETYIVPMNFGYEEWDKNLVLYFHCAKEGRKVDLIPRQKEVSFEMDTKKGLITKDSACQLSYSYQCIMGKGKLEIIQDHDAKIHGLRSIVSHYADVTDLEFKQEMVEAVMILKLTVSEWSCKEH
ncbi:MAG: pyridoxamine 5'-phosphate oxidase family protein [Lachnospiraceae bacterium]|nr:pyridoxamine 5'-phosphate oxidase family protein [Lachnospiraceae bacterium]